MKIHVGKAYEGRSGNSFKDGDYELQIIKIEATRGRAKFTFATSGKRLLYKTFFLLAKDGKTENESAYRELADFVTTALQIEEEDVELDVRNAVGCYLTLTLKNSSYEKDGVKQSTYWLNRPRRCDGFSDGTGSVIEEILSKNKKMAEEAEEESAPVEEDKTEVAEESNDDSYFD